MLVNPTAATQTVALGEPMTSVEGVPVTSVTLASGQAEILTQHDGLGRDVRSTMASAVDRGEG